MFIYVLNFTESINNQQDRVYKHKKERGKKKKKKILGKKEKGREKKE